MPLRELLGTAAKLALGYAGARAGARLLREGITDLGRGIGGSLAKGEPDEQEVAVADPLRMRTYKVRGIDDRIAHIRRMARKGRDDPEFRRIVSSILTRTCGRSRDGKTVWCLAEKNWEAEILAVFAAVRGRVRYTRDIEGKDTYQHPLRTWQLRTGDCDDFSSLLGAILLSAGYAVRFRVIRTKGSTDWDHIFVVVDVPRGDRKMVFPVTSDVRNYRGPHGGWVALPATVEHGRAWGRVPDSALAAVKRAALDATVDRPAGWHPPRGMIAAVRDFRV